MDIVLVPIIIRNWPSGGSGLSATFATGYFNGSSNYVYWGHEDNMNKDDYAFMNSYHGYTYINAKATKDIRFRIDNNEKMILDPFLEILVLEQRLQVNYCIYMVVITLQIELILCLMATGQTEMLLKHYIYVKMVII